MEELMNSRLGCCLYSGGLNWEFKLNWESTVDGPQNERAKSKLRRSIKVVNRKIRVDF